MFAANQVKGQEKIIVEQSITVEASKDQNSDIVYGPSVELSTRNSKKRNLFELDYMQPVYSNNADLGIVDLKLKADNN